MENKRASEPFIQRPFLHDTKLPEIPDVPCSTVVDSNPFSTSSSRAQPDPVKPNKPPKPTTLAWKTNMTTSITGPALVNELRVPAQGQNPSQIIGQGHINVNLSPSAGNSPVASPTSSQNNNSRGTVTSSLNFRSPTTPTSPSRPPHPPPLKFGWAEHVFGSGSTKKNTNLQPNQPESYRSGGQQRRPAEEMDMSSPFVNKNLQGVHKTNVSTASGGVSKNPLNLQSQVPIGFDRILNESPRLMQDTAVGSGGGTGVSVSAISRKKDPCKPIFKRHSADLNKLIGSARECRQNQFPSNAYGTIDGGLGAGPSSLGANENISNASQSQPPASNRKYLCSCRV